MTIEKFLENKAFVERAQKFAHEAHDSIGQKRKYTGVPYWKHTDDVAAIVSIVTDAPYVIAAAHLHDVLEDVQPLLPDKYHFGVIEREFGHYVALYVNWLTDVYTKENYPKLNRAERKKKEVERIATISPEIKTVKLADLINNTIDIVENDSGFAITYLKEKEAMLEVLTEGNSFLYKMARSILEESWTKLGGRK
jgi:(p)ppGpp synthase/HD superfamily hydrolase